MREETGNVEGRKRGKSGKKGERGVKKMKKDGKKVER
jgi:hypothetical protein